MDEPVPRQFRPTIIIFVGTVGEVTTGQTASIASTISQGQGTDSASQSPKSVYEYFCDLSTMLDPVLYQGIGLLTIDEGGTHTKVLSMTDSEIKSGDFTPLLTGVLHDIRGYRSIYEIEDAGYPVLTQHPQIYIVGQTDSTEVSNVAEQLNTLLGDERPLALISYVLTEEHTPLPQQQPVIRSWVENLLSNAQSMPLVNFCYIYEEMGQHLLYMEEADIRYAVAETLFGFVATGITAASLFKTATSLSLTNSDADARIGSLGTSLIKFPRTHVESYCIDMHGVELVNNWMNAMQLSKEQQEALNLHVREQAQQMGDRLSDNARRPGFGERSWPNLAFLEDDFLKYQVKEATENIFRNFSNRKRWAADPKGCEAQALQDLSAWKDATKQAWEKVKNVLERQVSGEVDKIWLQDKQGILAAKVYADQLDIALGQVRDSFKSPNVSHQETYEEALQVLQERGDGPWVSQPSTSNSQTGDIPNREREIIENLSKRVEWLRNRVPKTATLVAVSMMAMIPLVWLLLTLLPSATPPLTALIVVVATSLSAAGAWFYCYWSEYRVRKAEEDLLRVYCLYFAYQCECWEDMLRTSMLDGLIQTVKGIPDQLKDFERYLSEIAKTLREDAEHTEHVLFDSPSSYRDVFIANKDILSKHGYCLAKFNQVIVDLRRTAPKEEWHSTPSKVYKRLGEFLTKQGISLIGIKQDDLKKHIRQFARMMVALYLQGELVEIAAALKAQGDGGKRIIERALENAQVLYRPYQTIPALSYYICGRQEQCTAIPEKAIPPNATMIWTSNPDWLLMTCFWTGGARTRWSIRASTQTMPSSTVAKGLPSAPAWS